MEDIHRIDMKSLSPHEMRKAEFASLDLAYEFYNWYARANGFSVRKSKIERSKSGDILQRTFVCHKQGFREDRGLTIENRKREPKAETRCGCDARFRVHIDLHSTRWLVTWFTDQHNHGLLPEKYNGMLPAHRKMDEFQIYEVNNMLKNCQSVLCWTGGQRKQKMQLVAHLASYPDFGTHILHRDMVPSCFALQGWANWYLNVLRSTMSKWTGCM